MKSTEYTIILDDHGSHEPRSSMHGIALKLGHKKKANELAILLPRALLDRGFLQRIRSRTPRKGKEKNILQLDYSSRCAVMCVLKGTSQNASPFPIPIIVYLACCCLPSKVPEVCDLTGAR
jgi:hypothetical protein